MRRSEPPPYQSAAAALDDVEEGTAVGASDRDGFGVKSATAIASASGLMATLHLGPIPFSF